MVLPENKHNVVTGDAAPQIVDPTTPGSSLGLPPPFVEWIEEYGKNGIVIK